MRPYPIGWYKKKGVGSVCRQEDRNGFPNRVILSQSSYFEPIELFWAGFVFVVLSLWFLVFRPTGDDYLVDWYMHVLPVVAVLCCALLSCAVRNSQVLLELTRVRARVLRVRESLLCCSLCCSLFCSVLFCYAVLFAVLLSPTLSSLMFWLQNRERYRSINSVYWFRFRFICWHWIRALWLRAKTRKKRYIPLQTVPLTIL